jgi:hypothetical protein
MDRVLIQFTEAIIIYQNVTVQGFKGSGVQGSFARRVYERSADLIKSQPETWLFFPINLGRPAFVPRTLGLLS